MVCVMVGEGEGTIHYDQKKNQQAGEEGFINEFWREGMGPVGGGRNDMLSLGPVEFKAWRDVCVGCFSSTPADGAAHLTSLSKRRLPDLECSPLASSLSGC